jgi:hypothetical protein
MVDMVVHRHALRDTLARICRLLTRPQPGREVALPARLDGVNSHQAPNSMIARVEGEIVDIEIEEGDDALSSAAGNGADPRLPQRA